MDRSFKGVWIPREIWLMKELSVLDRCLYAEIDSLDNHEGCYASDDYFADFFGVHMNTIRGSIKRMIEKNLIRKDGKRGKSRVLRIKTASQTEFDFDTNTMCNEKKQKLSTSNLKSNTKNNLEDIPPEPVIEKPVKPNMPCTIIDVVDSQPTIKKPKKKKPFEEMTPYQKVVDTYWNCFKTATGNEPLINGTTGKHVKMLLKQPLEQVLTVIKKYFETSFWFNENQQYDFKQITCHYNLILSAAGKKKTGNSWYEINKEKIDANFPGVN